MLEALLIALLLALLVGVVFRFVAPEWSGAAAVVTFVVVLLVKLGVN